MQAGAGTWLIKEDGTTTYNGESFGPEYDMSTNDKGSQCEVRGGLVLLALTGDACPPCWKSII